MGAGRNARRNKVYINRARLGCGSSGGVRLHRVRASPVCPANVFTANHEGATLLQPVRCLFANIARRVFDFPIHQLTVYFNNVEKLAVSTSCQRFMDGTKHLK